MTTPVPVTPGLTPVTPAPKKPSFASRIAAAFAWARSSGGRKDIGAVVAVATAIYTGLHRAGVF